MINIIRYKTLMLLGAVVFLASGCSDDDMPTATIKTVNLNGLIAPLDEFKHDQSVDLEDASIVLQKRTNQQIVRELTADANGKYTVGDLPISEYILNINGGGYGSFQGVLEIPLNAAGDFYTRNEIRATSSTEVVEITDIDEATVDGKDGFNISGTISSESQGNNMRGVRLYFTKIQTGADQYVQTQLVNSGTNFTLFVEKSNLLKSTDVLAANVSVKAVGVSALRVDGKDDFAPENGTSVSTTFTVE